MNNEWNEELVTKLRRELLWTRIFTVISSILMLCILVGGYLVVNRVIGYEKEIRTYAQELQSNLEELTPVVEQLAQLDVDALNETLNQLNIVVAEVDWAMLSDSIASVDWEKLSQQISALDVDAINDAIEGLDTKEFSEALGTLNDTVEKLRAIGESLSNFTSKFGLNVG